jgi:hypothetical protein
MSLSECSRRAVASDRIGRVETGVTDWAVAAAEDAAAEDVRAGVGVGVGEWGKRPGVLVGRSLI